MAKAKSLSLPERLDPARLLYETRKLAAWLIDSGENLARHGLNFFQQRTTVWAKTTPFAVLFDAQKAFAERLIRNSARFARSVWRVEKTEASAW